MKVSCYDFETRFDNSRSSNVAEIDIQLVCLPKVKCCPTIVQPDIAKVF